MPDPRRRAHAGILRPADAKRRLDLRQLTPTAALAPWVDHLWCVTWQAPEGHVQEVVPRPAVQVVAERVDGVPRLLANGVMTTRFERRLVGDDRAVGASFSAAGFRPFLGGSLRSLRDRVVDLGALPGHRAHDDRDLATRLLDPAVPVEDAAALLCERLVLLDPRPDPLTAELTSLVERAEQDRTLTRAEQLAALAGVSLRTLQRRFVEHVGVGPKWVVQRCRLLDVAAAAHDGGPVDWAGLAASLGYADQSHLIRAFTRLVGSPPATYAARR